MHSVMEEDSGLLPVPKRMVLIFYFAIQHGLPIIFGSKAPGTLFSISFKKPRSQLLTPNAWRGRDQGPSQVSI
jgi:hypothetical protein